jgi:hypothetical protein
MDEEQNETYAVPPPAYLNVLAGTTGFFPQILTFFFNCFNFEAGIDRNKSE